MWCTAESLPTPILAAAPPASLSPASSQELVGSPALQVDKHSLNDDNRNLITRGSESKDSMGLAQILVTKGRVDLLEDVMSLMDDINATKFAERDAVEIASKRFSPYFDTIPVRQNSERQPAKRFQCVFCAYHISNRTQVVQHLMRRHFFYSPYRCLAWFVLPLHVGTFMLINFPVIPHFVDKRTSKSMPKTSIQARGSTVHGTLVTVLSDKN
jgi:hypothetical protein